MKPNYKFISYVISHQNLLYEMTKRDLLKQYRSSFLGVFWIIVEPIAFMLMLAFVFDVGLKAGKMMQVPFVAYLLTGMSIFFLFSGVLGEGAGIVKNNAYLLNKVSFDVSVLPLVKIFSHTIIHYLTLLPVLVILMYLGIFPDLYWLQTIYYLFALIVYLLGLVWLIAALGVIVPDIHNIVSIVNKFLLYLSPVFWDISVFPSQIHFFLKLNPMYYIIQGYRDSLLFHKGFWTHPGLTLYFWSIAIGMFIIGASIFNRMKVHFSDYV